MEEVNKIPEGARVLSRVARPLTAPEFSQAIKAWLQELGLTPELVTEASEALDKQAALSREHITCPQGSAKLTGTELIIGIGPNHTIRLPLQTEIEATFDLGRAPDKDRTRFNLPVPVDIRTAEGQTQTIKLPYDSLPGQAARVVDVGGAAPVEPLPEIVEAPEEPSVEASPQYAKVVELDDADLLASPPEAPEVPTAPVTAPKATVKLGGTKKKGKAK